MLRDRMLPLRAAIAGSMLAMPLPMLAALAEKVLLVTARTAPPMAVASLKISPPLKAMSPAKVLLVTVALPKL